MEQNHSLRKKLMKLGAVAAGSAIVIAGSAHAVGTFAKNRSIDEQQARNFAYIDAEVEPENILYSMAEFEWDGGSYIYEVDFRTADASYEYEVLASDGTILARSTETLAKNESGNKAHVSNPEPQTVSETAPKKEEQTDSRPENTKQPQKDPVRKYISVDEAKSIALRHFELTADTATFTETKFDYEDGRRIYSIELVSGALEYEAEIDAVTGDVLESSRSSEDPSGDESRNAADHGTMQQPEEAGTSGDDGNKKSAHREYAGNNDDDDYDDRYEHDSDSDDDDLYDYDSDDDDDDRHEYDGNDDDDRYDYDSDDGDDDDRYDYDSDDGDDDDD